MKRPASRWPFSLRRRIQLYKAQKVGLLHIGAQYLIAILLSIPKDD